MSLKRAWYVFAHWEQWHYNVKYVLLSPLWLWYTLRSGSFYFFSPANPTLTFGGFEGGPKKEIYELLPPGTYPKSIFIDPLLPPQKVEALMAESSLQFPVAVKPNIGMMGLLFRKIDSPVELSVYHNKMDVEYIVQELITYPIEVSVFYYRFPGEKKGHITGFVRKESLEVTGDGRSTLGKLMEGLLNRPGFKIEEWSNKHKNKLNDVIAEGERYPLSWVANLSRGGRLVSLENEKDERLLELFDKISNYSGHIYYGRYDIKCTSIADLKAGKNFSILEFNGTGAEPHHVYGNGLKFLEAAKIINDHWSVLSAIARRHNRHEVKYKTLVEGLQFTRKANRHFKKLKALDADMPVFH